MAEPFAIPGQYVLPGLAGLAGIPGAKEIAAALAAAAATLYGPARIALDAEERRRFMETAQGVADFARRYTLAGKAYEALRGPTAQPIAAPGPFQIDRVFTGEGVTPATRPFEVFTGGGVTPVGQQAGQPPWQATLDAWQKLQALRETYTEAPPGFFPPGVDVQVAPPQFRIAPPEWIVQGNGGPPGPPERPSWDTMPWWALPELAGRAKEQMSQYLQPPPDTYTTAPPVDVEPVPDARYTPRQFDYALPPDVQPVPPQLRTQPLETPEDRFRSTPEARQRVRQVQTPAPQVDYQLAPEPVLIPVAPASFVRARDLPPLSTDYQYAPIPEPQPVPPQLYVTPTYADVTYAPPIEGAAVPPQPYVPPVYPGVTYAPELQVEPALRSTPEARERVRAVQYRLAPESAPEPVPPQPYRAPTYPDVTYAPEPVVEPVAGARTWPDVTYAPAVEPEPVPPSGYAPQVYPDVTYAPELEVQPVPGAAYVPQPYHYAEMPTPQPVPGRVLPRPVYEPYRYAEVPSPEPIPGRLTPRPVPESYRYAEEPKPQPVPPGLYVKPPVEPYRYAELPEVQPIPGRVVPQPIVEPYRYAEIPEVQPIPGRPYVAPYRYAPEPEVALVPGRPYIAPEPYQYAEQPEVQPVPGAPYVAAPYRYAEVPEVQPVPGAMYVPQPYVQAPPTEPQAVPPSPYIPPPYELAPPIEVEPVPPEPLPPTVRGTVAQPSPLSPPGRGYGGTVTRAVPPPPEEVPPTVPTEPARDPITGWTDDEWRRTTGTVIGVEMGADEMNEWLRAFAAEHEGLYPWDVGPGDGANNLIDHLLALRESRQLVETRGQAAVTRPWWEQAHAERYGLAPGEFRPLWAPYELGQQRLR